MKNLSIENILKKSPLPLLESQILLSNLLGKDRSFLTAFSEKEISLKTTEKFFKLVKRRELGEPIAYLLGYKEFFGLQFFINRSVLIPRNETEDLVEEAIKFLRKKNSPTVVEVGTGSGCIAIAIAKHTQNVKIIASDISSTALKIARKNAFLNTVRSIEFRKSNLLQNIDEKADLIVANLPYIPTQSWEKLPEEIKNFEPRKALDSGKEKMTLYRKLFFQSLRILKKNGALIYELDGKIIQVSAGDLEEMARE